MDDIERALVGSTAVEEAASRVGLSPFSKKKLADTLLRVRSGGGPDIGAILKAPIQDDRVYPYPPRPGAVEGLEFPGAQARPPSKSSLAQHGLPPMTEPAATETAPSRPVPQPDSTPFAESVMPPAEMAGTAQAAEDFSDIDIGEFSSRRTAADDEIEYEPFATALQFHNSSARVKAIMGPVGCLDRDTEVLTPQGWVAIGDWAGGEIAQWSPDGAIIFARPEDYIVAPCAEMHTFNSGAGVDMVLSSEHRVPLYNTRGKLVVRTAEQLARKPSRYTVPVTFRRAGPGVALNDALLRVWAMLVAGRRYPGEGRQVVVAARGPREADRARMVLRAAGMAHTETASLRAASEVRFAFECPDLPGHFDDRVYQASSTQAAIITQEASFWGGSRGRAGAQYVAAHKDQADKVQFLAHLAGRKAYIRAHKDPSDPSCLGVFTVAIARERSRRSTTEFRGGRLRIGKTVPVDGKKYCFVTSTGFFLARRNGCVFVTGNSGKSVACAMEIFFQALRVPAIGGVRRSRWLVVRSTFGELKSTTIETFRFWLGHIGVFRFDSPITFTCVQALPDGTKLHFDVFFMPLDREPDVSKLRSLEITGAWLNEGSVIENDFLSEILLRLRFEASKYKNVGQPWRGIIIDSNFPTTRHWLYKRFEEDRPAGWAMFKQPPALLRKPDGAYVANPAAENIENLPDGYEYYMNMVRSSTEDKIKVLVLAEYGSVFSGKAVYAHVWNDTAHMALRPVHADRSRLLVVGMDWGLSPSAVFTQMTSRGSVHVLAELVAEDILLEDFLNDMVKPTLQENFRGFETLVIGDPAGRERSSLSQRTAIQTVLSHGIAAEPAISNDPILRREAVGYFLTRMEGFVMDPRCVTLREGFNGGYKFANRRVGEGHMDKPDKNFFSHVHDGLQYACLHHYRPVIDMRARNRPSQSGGSAPPLRQRFKFA